MQAKLLDFCMNNFACYVLCFLALLSPATVVMACYAVRWGSNGTSAHPRIVSSSLSAMSGVYSTVNITTEAVDKNQWLCISEFARIRELFRRFQKSITISCLLSSPLKVCQHITTLPPSLAHCSLGDCLLFIGFWTDWLHDSQTWQTNSTFIWFFMKLFKSNNMNEWIFICHGQQHKKKTNE